MTAPTDEGDPNDDDQLRLEILLVEKLINYNTLNHK
jgi:hypothetical protein